MMCSSMNLTQEKTGWVFSLFMALAQEQPVDQLWVLQRHQREFAPSYISISAVQG